MLPLKAENGEENNKSKENERETKITIVISFPSLFNTQGEIRNQTKNV